jgi:hypothetical protein
MLMVLCTSGFGRIVSNYSPPAFAVLAAAANNINTYVIQGGGAFLKSHSNVSNFLNLVEISEIYSADYIELQSMIDSAMQDMAQAEYYYTQLNQVAQATPYNPAVIGKLQTFNYKQFQNTHNLNPDIFWEVRRYLKSGDVRGVYQKMLLDAQRIKGILGQLHMMLSNNNMPGNSILWKINQEFFTCLMFDQYTAMVFYEILIVQ